MVLLNCMLRSYSWKSQGQLWWKTSSARDVAHFCGVSGCNSIISHRVSMFLQNNQDWGVTPLSVRESLCSYTTMKTPQRQKHLRSLHIGMNSQGSSLPYRTAWVSKCFIFLHQVSFVVSDFILLGLNLRARVLGALTSYSTSTHSILFSIMKVELVV